MEIIQIVIDSKLLAATDRAVRRTGLNRSALIRDALRAHLKRLAIREREERDRRGYEAAPQAAEEGARWEPEAVWPEEQRVETSICIDLPLRTRCGRWLSLRATALSVIFPRSR